MRLLLAVALLIWSPHVPEDVEEWRPCVGPHEAECEALLKIGDDVDGGLDADR